MQFAFIVFPVLYYQNILKLSSRPFGFASCKLILENKKKSGTSLPALFSAWFYLNKYFLLYFITWPNFIVWFSLLREILVNMCIVIFVN